MATTPVRRWSIGWGLGVLLALTAGAAEGRERRDDGPTPVRLATLPTDTHAWAVRYAPDASQVGWIEATGPRERLRVNGRPGPVADRVHDRYLLGAGGRRCAYAAQVGDAWFPVIDHVMGEAYDRVMPPVSDAAGHLHHIAFPVQLQGEWYVRVDDELYGPWHEVRELRFSADGHHVAWIARAAGTDRVIVNGRELSGSRVPRCGALALDADSDLVSYRREGRRVTRCIVGTDPVLWPRDAVGCVFGPLDRRLYLLGRADGRVQPVYAQSRGPVVDTVLEVAIGPRAERWAVIGLEGERRILVIDGERVDGGERPSAVTFSPDGAHVAWRTERGAEARVVIDGGRGVPFPGLGRTVAFTADGRHVTFGAQRGGECWREVLPVRAAGDAAGHQGDNPR